jgi:acyl-CoA synthetase (AMP-forming)/AMP-acid ligase II
VPTAAATVGAALARAATSPDTGLRFVDRHENASFVSWAEVAADARQTARGLLARGLGRGERVALVFPTGREFFAGFFGALLAGGVPVPLYPPVRLGRLDEYHQRTARMVQVSGAVLVLADRLVRRLLGEAMATARPRLGCLTLAELAESAHELPITAVEQAAATVDAEDLALVQFSSGTTVDPKPVALSHRAILAQGRILSDLWPDRPGVRHSGLSWLPLYHDMGLIGCVLPALHRPTDLTLIGPEVFVSRPAIWLRALSCWRATVSPAPNFAYGLCVAKIRDEELAGVDLSHWQAALNGAEAVSPAVLRAFCVRFARWGFRREALTPVYGLSEAALAVTFSSLGRPFKSACFARASLAPGAAVEEQAPAAAPPDGLLAAPAPDGNDPMPVELASVGRPLPGFAVAIRDGDGNDVPAGRVGRVFARGPSLMAGYLGQPEATARVLVDGWLDTGDLGFLLDGELFLTGRAKDLVILRGRNHLPDDIEQAVSSLPGVRTGCVAAASHLPAGAATEELVVMVESPRPLGRRGRETLAARVRASLLTTTGLLAERVEVLAPGTLLRTSSGKIRRQESLRLLLVAALHPPEQVGPLRLLGAMARSERAFRRLRRAGGTDR